MTAVIILYSELLALCIGRRLPTAYWASKSLNSMIGTCGRAQAATAKLAELLPVLGRFTGGG